MMTTYTDGNHLVLIYSHTLPIVTTTIMTSTQATMMVTYGPHKTGIGQMMIIIMPLMSR